MQVRHGWGRRMGAWRRGAPLRPSQQQAWPGACHTASLYGAFGGMAPVNEHSFWRGTMQPASSRLTTAHADRCPTASRATQRCCGSTSVTCSRPRPAPRLCRRCRRLRPPPGWWGRRVTPRRRQAVGACQVAVARLRLRVGRLDLNLTHSCTHSLRRRGRAWAVWPWRRWGRRRPARRQSPRQRTWQRCANRWTHRSQQMR